MSAVISTEIRAGRARVERALRSAWLAPTAFMAVAGLTRCGKPEMWQDELVTIDVATRSTAQIFRLLGRVDAVHGAYYLFMHWWIAVFGDSPTAVRIPSALAMAGAAACVALTGQRLFGTFTGAVSGLVFSLVPSISRFAQETRSYAFVVLFAALSTLLLLRAMERSTLSRWAGYALCVAGMASVNTVSLTIVAGHGLGVIIWLWRRWAWRTFAAFIAAVLAGAALAGPVIYLGLQQATTQINWIEHELLWEVWPKAFSSTWGAWTVTALAVAAWIRPRREVGFAFVIALVPALVIWLVSVGDLNYLFAKYLLFLIPAWAVLAGAGLTALPWRSTVAVRSVAVVGLVVLTMVVAEDQIAMRRRLSHMWYTYPAPAKRTPLDYSTAARIIADGYQPGDGVVYLRGGSWWYMHDKGVRYYLPERVVLHDIFLFRPAAEVGQLDDVECRVPSQCVGSDARVWVVAPYYLETVLGWFPLEEKAALDEHYRQAWSRYVSGMTVGLLVRTR